MNLGPNITLPGLLSELENSVHKVSKVLEEELLLEEGTAPLSHTGIDFERSQRSWKKIEVDLQKIRTQMAAWKKEKEGKEGRKELNNPLDEEEDSPFVAIRKGEEAYQAHKEEWNERYAGQYIAVYQDEVIDSDTDDNELASRMIEKQLKDKKSFRACILKIKTRSKRRRKSGEKASSSSQASLA